jgi:hypothetical protein
LLKQAGLAFGVMAEQADMKRYRLVEVVGNHKRLGKNGRRRGDKDMEGQRPFASKFSANSKLPTQPSQAASA